MFPFSSSFSFLRKTQKNLNFQEFIIISTNRFHKIGSFQESVGKKKRKLRSMSSIKQKRINKIVCYWDCSRENMVPTVCVQPEFQFKSCLCYDFQKVTSAMIIGVKTEKFPPRRGLSALLSFFFSSVHACDSNIKKSGEGEMWFYATVSLIVN